MDSDWGVDVDKCWSVSGYVFSLGCGAISWSSKKKAMVATSSTKVEYMASCHATKEAMWLCALIKLIGFQQKKATLISCDNNGSNMLGRDPHFTNRQNILIFNTIMLVNRLRLRKLFSHISPAMKIPQMYSPSHCNALTLSS